MNSPTSSEVAIARQGVIAIERRCGVTVDYCQWASETSGMVRPTIGGRLRRPSVNAPVFSRPSRAANAPCGLFASPARPGAITASLLRSFNQYLL